MDPVLEKLKIQLDLQEWPAVYLFKFIVPNKDEQVAQINALFDENVDLVMHPSRNGNFMSVSAKELMINVDSILEKYTQAAKINGLISL
jgi:hypothetical protein